MSEDPSSAEYDRARASVLVRVPQALAFQIFTQEIDLWWRHGLKYRVLRSSSRLRLEPGLGGRLLESPEPAAAGDTRLYHTGTVLVWDPPQRLELEWRGVNFAPGESTLICVEFEPSASGTRVTVTHSGFARLRPDHPVRHGQLPSLFIGRMALWWGELLAALREHALQQGRTP